MAAAGAGGPSDQRHFQHHRRVHRLPHAYPTLPEELTLCMQLLLPCLEAALFLCRVRRDLFEKYTPLFNPMAGAASDRHM